MKNKSKEIINLLAPIEKDSLNKNIPIIPRETALYLIDFIQKNEIKNILEIGTASCYSGLVMALSGAFVTTIERDQKMYELALLNKSKHSTAEISLIYEDALLIDLEKLGFYDLIFIDGAKGQYNNFLIKFQELLNKDGVIIFDNMDFHNLDINKVSRRTKSLIQKINQFKENIKDNPLYNYEFVNVGDGLLILRKKD